jgi:Fission yeast centromere protein N-terminal domain
MTTQRGTERRRGITIEQRRALRRWAHHQFRKPSQKQCIKWFFYEYNHRLGQSTISKSLSDTFRYLDSDSPNTTSLRRRTGHWPDIEKLLWD